MVSHPAGAASAGLASLRDRALLAELLFLYECVTLEPPRLRGLADRLGLSVQAASHTFRGLRRRGLVTVENGRYRPTILGVERLHAALDELSADLRTRLGRLHVVRSTRAVAADGPLSAGDKVTLEIRDGVLSARRTRSGPSRGTVVRGAAAGGLVEVGSLEGIVPIEPGEITVRTVSESDLEDPRLSERIRHALPDARSLLACEGLEAFHAVAHSTRRPVERFAAAAACLEASRLGVPSAVFVLERELPRLLGSFSGPTPPKLRVLPIGVVRPKRPARGRPARR